MRSTIGSTKPMTRSLVIKHLRIQENGTYKYRRRVPQKLQKTLGKTEFVKVLGKSEYEALRNYQPYHDHVEHLLNSARPQADAAELVSIKTGIEAQFAEMKLDPYSPGKTEEEILARTEEADRILSKYVVDPSTGQPDPKDVSLGDGAMVTALIGGVDNIEAELTISQAFAFYLDEKKEPDPFKRKKQLQRFARAQRNLLNVTKQDIALSKLTRAHARRLRDNLLRSMKVTAVRRNINDVKAVMSMAIREHDLNLNNPFAKLEYPKPTDAAVDLRHPLPADVIRSMYVDLTSDQTLLNIWTLIHHSGAQSAEILGLSSADVNLDDPIPHFDIKPQGLRSVKDRSRIRKVPLVGRALEVAKCLMDQTQPGTALFPKYADTSKHDSFSQATRKRLRKFTDNPKHVVYSLRHNMKDALRKAGVGERVELALLGHSDERTASSQYGSGVGLDVLQDALLRIPFDVPEEIRTRKSSNS